MVACALVALVVSGYAAAATAGGSGANCTAAQKTSRQRAVTAYRRRMAVERKAYFRGHRNAAQRKAFVERQQAKLKRLARAAACTVPPPAPPPPAPPAAPVFTFGPGVTAEQADEIRNDIAAARAYLAKLGPLPAQEDVRAYADAESTAQAYAAATNTPIESARRIWETSTAVAARGVVFVNVGGTFWRSATAPLKAKVLAHESFHLVQERLAGSRWVFGADDAVPGGGPRWLIEGAAELVGYSAVADTGVLSMDQARRDQIANVKYADGPLRDYEIQRGMQRRAAYNLAFVAVDYLVREKGVGSLLEFWRTVGTGAEWKTAFQNVFGVTVDRFYTEFEQYRQTL